MCSVDGSTGSGVEVSAISTTLQTSTLYVFRCRLKVDSDVADVTNDGRLFHAREPATGKAQSPIVLRRVTGTTTADDELERKCRLRLVDVCRAIYTVSQVDWCCAIKTPEDEGRQLEPGASGVLGATASRDRTSEH